MMDEQKLAILFQKYLNKTATASERQEFFHLVSLPEADPILRKYSELFTIAEAQWQLLEKQSSDRILTAIFEHSRISDVQNTIASTSDDSEEQQNDEADASNNQYKVATTKAPITTTQSTESHSKDSSNEVSIHSPTGRQNRRWLAAAAIILLLIGGSYYYKNFFHRERNIQFVAGNQVIKDVLPGHAGAILTLGNGQNFLLDTISNGRQIASGITKSAEGLQINNSPQTMAVLRTPMGRQQKLVLSDGTKVWLNAGSSISFPTEFTENLRKVYITGEVYFEVVHNEKMPFEVHTGNDIIYDLGTKFNVNAYNNEAAMKVTLLEGSVQVGSSDVLKPGEAFSAGKVSKVNATDAIAWVGGFFHFDRADITTVMRQIARWYDVEVDYKGTIPPMKFGGEIQKSLKLSAVLNILSATGIHYTLNGRHLTIRP